MRVEKAYRGISKRLAVHYLENLGGDLVAGEREGGGRTRVAGDGWTATLSAETVSVAGSLELTEVTVVFDGEDDAVEDLLARFSQKAMRAGG